MGQNYSSKLVTIGSVGAPFGVHGWLKVNSYTEPRDNILRFKKWLLVDEEHSIRQPLTPSILEFKESKDKLLILFTGIVDRSQAATLTNKKIAIEREDLPQLAANEYYWADLIGSKVYNLSDELLGVVDYMFTTANDVMVVSSSASASQAKTGKMGPKKEYLIPYNVGEFIVNVDLPNKIITVNWDSD